MAWTHAFPPVFPSSCLQDLKQHGWDARKLGEACANEGHEAFAQHERSSLPSDAERHFATLFHKLVR